MKVCGFTIVRNAVKFDYPAIEAIQSILPLCDEFVVAVGNSDDSTISLIETIQSDKIKIVHTTWDDSLRIGGKVLAVETDKAFDAISDDIDWAFYIQADEVVHEKYHDTIYNAMKSWNDSPEVDGLLFKYEHFFGTYNYVGDSRKWYRNEIRVIRNNKKIRSYKDAQGFRKAGSKLNVKPIDAYVYHYGWVKDPKLMQDKVKTFNKYWHSDEWIKNNISETELFDYSKVDSIKKFNGTHPKVMKNRIENANWQTNIEPKQKKFNFKSKVLYYYEKLTGHRPFEYKNYNCM